LIVVVFVGLAIDGVFRRADVLNSVKALNSGHLDQL
jgi:hypothetical protein